MAVKYYLIEPTGKKGFITHEDNELSHIVGYPGNIWGTENAAWAARVGADELPKDIAQDIVTRAQIEGGIEPADEQVHVILP
jgi:hypothetical protein